LYDRSLPEYAQEYPRDFDPRSYVEHDHVAFSCLEKLSPLIQLGSYDILPGDQRPGDLRQDQSHFFVNEDQPHIPQKSKEHPPSTRPRFVDPNPALVH
jgi:hypothetical protein